MLSNSPGERGAEMKWLSLRRKGGAIRLGVLGVVDRSR